jgi:hypothetical protein
VLHVLLVLLLLLHVLLVLLLHVLLVLQHLNQHFP